MSKYSKLSDIVMRQKIGGFLKQEIPEEKKIEINKLLETFDRIKCEDLCSELEMIVNEIKDRKKRDEHKKLEAIQKLNEEDDDIIVEKKIEYPHLLEKGEFKKVKDSFGIFKENEQGDRLYSSLHEQFVDEMKSRNLKLYRVVYKYKNEYDSFREFIHKNFNVGMPDRFDYLREWCFACFRFNISSFDSTCVYTSWWIVDSPTSLNEMFSEEDNESSFEISEYNDSVESFCDIFKKNDAEWIIDQRYLR